MKTSSISLFFILISLVSNAQKNELNQLKKDLASANERAYTAEANARQALEDSRKFQMEAERSRMRAERAEAAATRSRYLAQAKAMAIKSLELGADPEQESLVALLAFKFNFKYGGNPNDMDIYNGLYTALIRNHDNLVKSFDGPKGEPMLISDSHFGETFSADQGRILRWTFQGTEWKSVPISDKHKDSITALALSPDENWLAAGGSSVELYDLKNPGKAPLKVSGFSSIKKLIFTSAGNQAYVLEKSGSIKFTDFKTVREVIKSKEQMNDLVISKDDSKLAGGSTSGMVYLWDLGNGYNEKVIFKNADIVTALTFAFKDRQVVIGDSRGQVKIFVVDADLPPRILTGHKSSIEQISFDHSSNILSTVGRDQTIRLWDWNNLTLPAIVLKDETQEAWSSNVVFSSKDNQLMIAFKDKSGRQMIHFWPLSAATMANSLCRYTTRNMEKDEWFGFVGDDLPYEKVCDN